MKVKSSFSSILFDCMNVFLLFLLMVVTLYPILHVMFSSFSDAMKLAAHTGIILKPLGFTLNAYKTVFGNPDIWTGYRNTIFYVVLGTFINIVMTSLGAYLLSRKDFYCKKYLSIMAIITMFFSGGLIPTYLVVKSYGMLNSVWALVIPGAISTWNLMIMKTSFAEIPDSLTESARIEGAGELRILISIILPLSLPIISVMVLYYGVGHWNSWFSAMVYIRNRKMYPLQIFLREILVGSTQSLVIDANDAESTYVAETVKHATIIVATLPILMVYPFIQKYFVKGIFIGAIKG